MGRLSEEKNEAMKSLKGLVDKRNEELKVSLSENCRFSFKYGINIQMSCVYINQIVLNVKHDNLVSFDIQLYRHLILFIAFYLAFRTTTIRVSF